MRSLKLLALFALVMFGLAGPAPAASAGGWALTVLDPVPERFEAGTSYTIGYWVLQHGTHPPDLKYLGTTSLRLSGPGGKQLTFEGVPLREPGHFATAIAIPKDGTWRVVALQGTFDEQPIGTLTVPGGLQRAKLDGPLPEVHSDHGDESPWGAVHPPAIAAAPGDTARPAAHASDHVAAGRSDTRPAADDGGLAWSVWPLIGFGLVGVAGVVLVWRRRTAYRAD